MHNVYFLHKFILLLLHVALTCAPSSGRTIMPFT